VKKENRIKVCSTIVGASLIWSAQAGGLPESLPDTSFTIADKFPVQVHGSFGAGYIKSSNNNYMNIESEDGTFQFNDLLLNSTIVLTDSLTAGAQLYSHDLGNFGNNDIKLDWAYLDYNFNEAFGVRLGRVKLGLGIYGNLWDIDAARTGCFLPMSTYMINFRDTLASTDGGQVYGTLPMGPGGSMDYQAHADINSGFEFRR
jgi:phosphate-selective porin